MLDRLEDGDDDDEEEREERRGAKDLVSLELEEALRITEALASRAKKVGTLQPDLITLARGGKEEVEGGDRRREDQRRRAPPPWTPC